MQHIKMLDEAPLLACRTCHRESCMQHNKATLNEEENLEDLMHATYLDLLHQIEEETFVLHERGWRMLSSYKRH